MSTVISQEAGSNCEERVDNEGLHSSSGGGVRRSWEDASHGRVSSLNAVGLSAGPVTGGTGGYMFV